MYAVKIINKKPYASDINSANNGYKFYLKEKTVMEYGIKCIKFSRCTVPKEVI